MRYLTALVTALAAVGFATAASAGCPWMNAKDTTEQVVEIEPIVLPEVPAEES